MPPRVRKPAPVKPPPECKECRALPYLEPGTEPVPDKQYRPRVRRPLAKDKSGKLVPGPRCTTHTRAKRAVDSAASHARRVVKTYGISSEFYWQLYEFQKGMCYICERAYGKSKRLAVDHNHSCTADHPAENACTLCVRGLLCTMCNRKIVGHLRDDPAAFRRGAEYLEDPPARRLLARLAA